MRGCAGFCLALVAASLVSCRSVPATGPHIVQPGAPGEPVRAISAGAAADLSAIRVTPADVRFMQGMIGHHAQALEMTALLADRSRREDLKLLGQRIAASQADEIAMMRDWLRTRGQPIPDEHAHHAPGAPLMPGMLTAEEMRQLAEARGVTFDRLFLELMIKHHAGALSMVRELFAQPAAAQDSEIYQFASDVEADQQMEIARMGALLGQLHQD